MCAIHLVYFGAEFFFLCSIQRLCLFSQSLGNVRSSQTCQIGFIIFQIAFFCDPAQEVIPQTNQIPLVVIGFFFVDVLLYSSGNQFLEHLEDAVVNVFAVQYLCTLLINDLTLGVHNVVVVKDVLSDVEVSALYLLL